MLTGNVARVVGETPLIQIQSLTELTGCDIYAKAEFLNPGGSVKDRAALGMIEAAEASGDLRVGDTIVEGTAGNTGIGLATIAAQKGYRCLVVMPDNQATEKYDILSALGAEVMKVPAVPFANENHFFHTAKRVAAEKPNRFWANQFENLANFQIHYATTAVEIWQQTSGKVAAFVSAAGSGGTIAGVSRYLKEKNPNVHVRLVDPMGSGLFSYLTTGKLAAHGSSVTEGIGIMRLTANFKEARIDDAVQVGDQDMISMLYHLARYDGLLVGTSAALNLWGAYRFGLEHKNQGLTIVTVICDSALRYQSRVFNKTFLEEKGLAPTSIAKS
ncbi:MAG: cysteine synthase A [Bdellovibrionales bacterium]|nr:cysteine synthase A [Bdellovibrionales bacterium]